MKKLYYILVFVLLGAFVLPTEAATSWSKYKILIDPGHGGSDSGAGGYGGAPHEATLALRCGKKLRDRITGELSGTVKMTRSTDTFISLTSRREMKGSYDPYIFCSIHLNAYNKTAKGTEVLYTNTTGNSSVLANKVYAQLKTNFTAVNGTNGYKFTARGVKTASLAVCRGYASVPACLTEGLFVDNKTEWNLIKTDGSKGYLRWVHGHLMGFYDRLAMLNSDIIKPNFDGTTSGGTTTPEPETPTSKITYSPTTVSLSGEVGSTADIYKDVTITATGLSADMSVASNTSGVTVKTLSGWNARTGGKIRCTLNTKYSLGASDQPYESYVAVESGSGTSKTRVQIPLEFKLTASTSGGTTTPPVEDLNDTLPSIKCDQQKVTLTGEYGATTQPTATVKITANNMENDLRIASNSSGIIASTGSDWNTRDGGSLIFTLNTKYSLGAGGPYSGYVAIESGYGTNITRIQVPFEFTLTPSTTGNVTPDYSTSSKISYSPGGTISLSGVYGASEQPYVDVTITATDLAADMTFNSASSIITPESQTGWDARTGGKLRFILNTQFVLGASDEARTGFVAIESGSGASKERVEIPFSCLLTATGSTTDPDQGGSTTDPDQGGTTTDPDQGGTTTPTTPDATYGAVNFFYQGGTPAVVPADNAALWALFMPDYNAWYAVHLPVGYKHPDTGVAEWKTRAEQEIAAVAVFADLYMKDFLTNTASSWKWLGDYMVAVAPALLGEETGTETYWRLTTQGFFNCYELYNNASTATTHWACVGDWTTAGKPDAWASAYIFGHQPTKAGATFLGWFQNANASGSALTTLPTSGNVYACWSGGSSVITSLEDINSSVRLQPTMSGVEIFFEGTAQVVVYNVNGVQVAADVATERFACDLQSGMYIIRVGNEVFKFIR